jgi:signal transduction histidine kinase
MPRTMMKYGLIPTIEQYIKNKATSKFDIEFKTNVEHIQIDKEIEITIYRTIVAIIENAKTSSATKDISIKINDNKSYFEVKIEIPGSFKFISEINIDQGGTDYIPFQKRIEFHGGQMLIVQDTKPKQTNIIIKFESPTIK